MGCGLITSLEGNRGSPLGLSEPSQSPEQLTFIYSLKGLVPSTTRGEIRNLSRLKEKTKRKVMEREAGGDGFSPGQTGNSLENSLEEEITQCWESCVGPWRIAGKSP